MRPKNVRVSIYFSLLFLNFLIGYFCHEVFAQSYLEIKEDPLIYARSLWFEAIPNEDFQKKVETILTAAVKKLREADQRQSQKSHAYFTKFFGERYEVWRDKKIIISKTPHPHLCVAHKDIQKFVLPFYLFLEDDPEEVVTSTLARLMGDYLYSDKIKGHEWARFYLDMKPFGPTMRAEPDYLKRLNPTQGINIQDFVDSAQIEKMTLRFRVLTDHEGLMVPVGRETRLIELVEGSPKNYPIEEIPLERLFHRVELQLLKNVISDLKKSELRREDVVVVSEGVLGLIIWVLLDNKAKKIPNAWLRRPGRILLFIGSIIIFEKVVHAGVKETGLLHLIKDEKIEERKKTQDILIFLMEATEKLKIGTLNIEEFKRNFCYSLGLRYDKAKEIYLTENEEIVLARVEADFDHYLKTRKEAIQNDLSTIKTWVERLKKATSYINRENGLTYYTIPPRERSLTEKGGNVAVAGGIIAMAGELVYNKFKNLRRILYTGRAFGGIALSALTIDYLLGISAVQSITLPEDHKEQFQKELEDLEICLTKIISTYDLLLKNPLSKTR